jgi:uracil phosphoribosyltransferase
VAYEAFADLSTSPTTVDTPVVAGAPARVIDQEFVVVPILRAGLGMSPAIQALLPRHRLCPMGLRRNEETLLPDTYLDGLPADLAEAPVIITDPMLATGGSLNVVIATAKQRGAGPITAIVLIASAPGVAAVQAAHPDVRIAAAALDEQLNDVGYIVPGLGDAGDRLFGPPVR